MKMGGTRVSKILGIMFWLCQENKCFEMKMSTKFFINVSSACYMVQIALRNEKRKKSYTVDVADFNLVMQVKDYSC